MRFLKNDADLGRRLPHVPRCSRRSRRHAARRSLRLARALTCIAVSLVCAAPIMLGGCGESSGKSSTVRPTAPRHIASTTSVAGASPGQAGAQGKTSKVHEARASKVSSVFETANARYIACLEKHGVPVTQLPPSPGRRPGVTGTRVPDTKSEAYPKARIVCVSIMTHALAKMVQQQKSAGSTQRNPLRIMTRCMRASGVPSYPEAKNGSVDLAAAHINVIGSVYRRAVVHCESTLADEKGVGKTSH